MTVLIYGYPVEGRIPQGDVLGARPNLVGMKVWDVERDIFTAVHPDEDVVTTMPEGAEPLTKLCGMSGSAVYVVEKSPDKLWLAGFMYKAAHTMNQVLATYADFINADGTIRQRA
jgi:hypothetical protein